MKIAYFASVLAMTTTLAIACNDNEDRVTPRQIAVAGTSGSASKDGGNADSASGGSGGSSGGGNEVAGSGGTPDRGGAGGGDAGGEPNGGAAEQAGAAGSGGAAGAGGEGSVSEVPLELLGSYQDNYGDSFEITQHVWGDYAIAAYDNDANVVYTQFPADDMYNPSKFAKTVYTEPANNSFYFCMVVFDADTLAAAEASNATADASDPENGGCGGQFPWTKATKK